MIHSTRVGPATLEQIQQKLSSYPFWCWLLDGRIDGRSSAHPEVTAERVLEAIDGCSTVYVYENRGVAIFPIAGFVANRSLEAAQLQLFVSREPHTDEGKAWPLGGLMSHLWLLLRQHPWIQRVLLPMPTGWASNELFDVAEATDDSTVVIRKQV